MSGYVMCLECGEAGPGVAGHKDMCASCVIQNYEARVVEAAEAWVEARREWQACPGPQPVVDGLYERMEYRREDLEVAVAALRKAREGKA